MLKNKTKIISMILVLTLVLSMMVSVNVSATAKSFVETFDDASKFEGLSNGAELVDEEDGSGKMLKNIGWAKVLYSFDAISEGSVLIDYSIKPGSGLDTLLYLNDSGSNSVVGTFFAGNPGDDGNNPMGMIFGTTDRMTNVESYLLQKNPKFDVWYDVKIYVDFTNNKVSTRVMQNGDVIKTVSNDLTLSDLSGFTFQVWNRADSKASYLDNFAVTFMGEDPGSESGMSFKPEEYNYSEKWNDKFGDVFPASFETMVYLPSEHKGSYGTIWGNYGNNKENDVIKFQIDENRHPGIWIRYKNSEGSLVYPVVVFEEAEIPTDTWVHLAITKDYANKRYICYINGKWKSWYNSESKSWLWSVTPEKMNLDSKFVLGGDFYDRQNAGYFKGKIRDFALYSDVRTADEIDNDYKLGISDKDNLLVHYDEKDSSAKVYRDLSGNGFDLQRYPDWIENHEPITDYSYSFAVVGDTQIVTRYNPNKFAYIYDWIRENAKSKNIKWTFGLGDITDKNTDDEYRLARACMKTLDGVVPYSFVAGNHDYNSGFNKFFSYDEFGKTVDGTFDGTMTSTYKKFKVGDVKYLALNLEIGPHDNVLEWANKIVEDNPDYNVIVSTHAYLNNDGKTLDAANPESPSNYGGDYYIGSNNGDDIWNKLIKKHRNIVLVLSGHIESPDIVMTKAQGDNGNTVTQMLINPQGVDMDTVGIGSVGMVAMLYFSQDGKGVDVEWYSTIQDKYLSNKSCFHTELDLIDPVPDVSEVKSISAISGISFNVELTGDTSEGTVFAALYSNDGKLESVKTYQAAANINVAFEEAEKGSYVKVMWLLGDKLIPLSKSLTPLSTVSE